MTYINKGPKKSATARKKERADIYNSRQWKKMRKAKIMMNPLCEECEKLNKITPARQVHHIDSFMDYEGDERLAKAFDFSNLESLCNECHEKMHNKKGTK